MDEITAEYAVAEVRPARNLEVRTSIRFGAKTDIGRVRDNNEDKYEFFIPSDEATLAEKGSMFVVCDGMGGHEAGQIASELATKTFLEVYYQHPASDPEEAIKAAIAAANRFVCDVSRSVPGRNGMGTTLTVLAIIQEEAVWGQVGDSRLYRLRGGELEQVTVDHTWIEETVRQGIMSRTEAEAHPYKHVITRAIGTDMQLVPDTGRLVLEEGDTFCLCSDGVTNHVTDEGLMDILQNPSPSQAAWDLVNAALRGGGSDNATCIVVTIDTLCRE